MNDTSEDTSENVVDEDLLSSWSFVLPEDRIARHPLAERAASRMLQLRRDSSTVHGNFRDIVDLLNEGDVLVVNDTTVLPARLFGEKAGSGGKVEVLLVRRVESATGATGATGAADWIVLLNASKKPKEGTRLVFPAGAGSFDALFAVVSGAVDDEPGAWRLRFEGDPVAFAWAHGAVPLPPYMQRAAEEDDGERYQTVYRDEDKAGSAAAPTAGLHFDEATLLALSEKGVRLTKVTLHVGPGTFLPVHSDRLSQHKMHPEPWWMSTPAAAALNEARATNKRIVAVGTTAARVLESARLAWAGKDGVVFGAGRGLTRLFIKPGHEVLAFDALLTNFHLPESTLLVLVGTLVGRRRILAAYNDAVAHGYRFYSYGDCCFIER